MGFEVDLARREEQGALENLFQLYVHDFSEFWAGKPQGELGDDGRFGPYPLDACWTEPDNIPLLFRVDGRLAGFALINKASHSGGEVDRNMAEFFVVRKHRRGALGSHAAQTIFSRYPGRWEAAIARANTAALAFWRRAVSTHPGLLEAEEVDRDDDHWNGPVLRFRIAG
jgi:predicted acetyltransferase